MRIKALSLVSLLALGACSTATPPTGTTTTALIAGATALGTVAANNSTTAASLIASGQAFCQKTTTVSGQVAETVVIALANAAGVPVFSHQCRRRCRERRMRRRWRHPDTGAGPDRIDLAGERSAVCDGSTGQHDTAAGIVTRIATLTVACVLLSGCVGHSKPSNAEWGAVGAGFGAAGALFRVDLLAGCWFISLEGITEQQSVSALCQNPTSKSTTTAPP